MPEGEWRWASRAEERFWVVVLLLVELGIGHWKWHLDSLVREATANDYIQNLQRSSENLPVFK